MKQLFWINFLFIIFSFINAQEISHVVNTVNDSEAKNNATKLPVIVAFKTNMDSFGLDWGFYGVKPGEGIDDKFNKSMLDWLILSKVTGVDQLIPFDATNPDFDYSHLVQWNLSIRKLPVQGKVQQFQLSFDYYLAHKNNLNSPFYKGSSPPEIRTFPADLVKQVPDILNKSLVNLAIAHWQKVRQTLMAIESSPDSFFVVIKNFKNINYVLNLAELWKDAGKNYAFDIKLESFDQVQARLKVLYRSTQLPVAMKVINATLPNNPEQFPFKLKQEATEEGILSFTVN